MNDTPRPFAQERNVTAKEDCNFYHWMDLPSGTVRGQWDLRGRIDDYLNRTPLEGRTVLDVGTASGFLSFEMERLGGTVVSFDAEDSRNLAFLPIYNHPFVTDYPAWCKTNDASLDRLKNSYWFCRRELQRKTRALYGDVYALDTYGYAFDVVVIGQILIHLKDPVNALAAASRVCKDTLVIAEGTINSPDTVAKMWARAAKGGPPYLWWQLSLPLYRELLEMFGFEISNVKTRPYLCEHESVSGDIPVTTIVAKRKHGKVTFPDSVLPPSSH